MTPIIGLLVMSSLRVEGQSELKWSNITVVITETSDQHEHAKPIEYTVSGRTFPKEEVMIIPFKHDRQEPIEKLFDAGGSLHARMQDPFDSFMLFQELAKGGYAKMATDFLIATNDPSVPEQIKKVYSRPDHLSKVSKRYESQKSVIPVLMTLEEEGQVVLYVWHIFGDQRLLNANRIKKDSSGWKMLPFLRSESETPQTNHLLEAIKSQDRKDGKFSMVIRSDDKGENERSAN